MARKKADLLQGTLNLLILKILRAEPLHGWGVAKRIRQVSDEVLEVNQGSLYPALYRMHRRGLVHSSWKVSGDGQRVKVYQLTAAGKKALAEEEDNWHRFSLAVEQILGKA